MLEVTGWLSSDGGRFVLLEAAVVAVGVVRSAGGGPDTRLKEMVCVADQMLRPEMSSP